MKRITALLLALVICFSCVGVLPISAAEPEQNYSEGTPAPQPILYLDMEDVTDAQVTNKIDNKSYAINGSSVKQAESLNGTKALEFDGSTTYINVGKDYQVTNAFTASALVNISSQTKDHAKLFGTGRTSVVEPTFSISVRRNGWNNICYDFAPNGSAWTEYNTVTFDKWHHLAVTGDAKKVTIYLDGTQLFTKDWDDGKELNIPDYVTDMLVGAGWNNGGDAPFANHMFKGLMDEVRLYDVALNAEQVAELYAQDITEPQPEPEFPEPILYLNMESTENNQVTNQIDSNSYTVNGRVKQAVSVNGTKALEFDGSTTYVNLGKDYQVSEAFTAAAWVKADSSVGDYRRVLSNGRSGKVQDTFDIAVKQDGTVYYYFGNYGSMNISGNFACAMQANEWQHIAVVGDNTGVAVYVNGELCNMKEAANLYINNYLEDLLLGTDWTSGGTANSSHMFKGLMDEVRLYDEALTADQIKALATVKDEEPDPEPEPESPNPLLYLNMDAVSNDGIVTNQVNNAGHQVYGVYELADSLNGTKALKFDGSTTYINVGKDYQVTNAFTASALVKITSGIKERARIFAVGRSGNASDVEINLNIKQSDHAAWYSISGVGYDKTDANTVAFDAWQHVTWVGTEDTMTVYVNGEQVYSKPWQQNGGKLNLGDYPVDMLIGTGMNGDGSAPFSYHTFKGLMDEVRLYNVALSAEQVAQLYEQDTTIREPQEDDPYLKQDGSPAYGVKTAVAKPGKLNWLETTKKMPVVVDTSKSGRAHHVQRCDQPYLGTARGRRYGLLHQELREYLH